MAYLEKKILVTIPVTEAHKTYLEKQASSGKYNCQFRYIPKEHVTKEDLEDTQVLIGNLPPALVREAKRLEWLQLNSAGADPYTPEGVLPAGAVLTSATGAYGVYALPATYFIDGEGYAVAWAGGMIGSDTLQQGIDMILE